MLKNTKRVMRRVVKQKDRLLNTAVQTFFRYLHGKLSCRESAGRTAKESIELEFMVMAELERLGRKAGEE
jgi:hypothetical protein